MKFLILIGFTFLNTLSFSQDSIEQNVNSSNEDLEEINMHYYESKIEDERTLEMIRIIKERRRQRKISEQN